MMSVGDSFHEEHLLDTNGTDDDWMDEDEARGVHSGEKVEDDGEGRSVTLRDILLQAGDMTQFHLLGQLFFHASRSFCAEIPTMTDCEMLHVDGSFAWA